MEITSKETSKPLLITMCRNCNKTVNYVNKLRRPIHCNRKCMREFLHKVCEEKKMSLYLGKRFWNTTVISFSHKKSIPKRDGSTNDIKYYFNARCDCGSIRKVSDDSLKSGLSKSCRPCSRKLLRLPIKAGEKYGNFEVLEITNETSKSGAILYKTKCECGEILNLPGTYLRSRLKEGSRLPSTRCKKCWILANTKHGMTRTSTYMSYRSMLSRCHKKNNKYYYNYGGRGIKVAPEWMTFEGFFKDMGEKPQRGMHLDRIDNDKNYEPGNCRWVTRKENHENRRISKKNRHLYITIRKDKLCEQCLPTIQRNE